MIKLLFRSSLIIRSLIFVLKKCDQIETSQTKVLLQFLEKNLFSTKYLMEVENSSCNCSK